MTYTIEAVQFETVIVPPNYKDRMIDHARMRFPNECCGVLGGRKNIITSVYPITNDMDSPQGYKANEKELFEAVRKMRAKGEEMIGLYHSHPHGDGDPSPRDKEQNLYPDHFYFIISFPETMDEPLMRCFVMTEDKHFHPIEMV